MTTSAARRLTLVATGCSSGLGYSTLQRLLSSPPPASRYSILLGSRSSSSALLTTLSRLATENDHELCVVPLDLKDLGSVRSFAHEVKRQELPVETLLLCAGVYKAAPTASVGGWGEEVVVNHFSQHLLIHLLKDTFAQGSRIVIVSSSLQNTVKSTDSLEALLRPNTSSPSDAKARYSASKFVQMVGAKYWKAHLGPRVNVVAVSPGFIPQTGLNRDESWLSRLFLWYILSWAPFCSTVEQGAAGIERAVTMSNEEAEELSKGLKDRDTVLYIDNQGRVLSPNPLSEEEELVKWLPEVQELERWE